MIKTALTPGRLPSEKDVSIKCLFKLNHILPILINWIFDGRRLLMYWKQPRSGRGVESSGS